MSENGWLSIGEVGRRARIQPSAIRYYESIGLLPEPDRVSGRRRYRQDIFHVLAVIDAAQRATLSLDDIRELLSAANDGAAIGDRLRPLADRRLRDIERLIEQAQAVKRWLEAAQACQCPALDECPLFLAPLPTELPLPNAVSARLARPAAAEAG